jgi:hypothetical protein
MSETIHLHGVAVVLPGGGVALLGDAGVVSAVADALVATGARKMPGPHVVVDDWVLTDPTGGDDAVLARIFVLEKGEQAVRRMQPGEAALELARHASLDDTEAAPAALFRRYAKIVATTPAVWMRVTDVSAAAERVAKEVE